MRAVVSLLALAVVMSSACGRAQAQADSPASAEECAGRVYTSKEVTRRAKLLHKPEPNFTDEARAHDVRGVVRLEAVLCRTGRVTDIKVIAGLPHGLTEKAIEATRAVRFDPARLRGRRVSQRVTFEYGFNVFGGGDGLDPEAATGRLVEELTIEGNRRLTDEDILRFISTRPGDKYDEGRARRDLAALLDYKFLDATQTRFTVERGLRGGVALTYSVAELPLISEIKLDLFGGVPGGEVAGALRELEPPLTEGSIYSRRAVESAKQRIAELYAARGHAGATVEVRVEEVSQAAVVLKFVVRERR
jgi:TonB family protein